MNLEKLERFQGTLGLDEPPMGLFYTDAKPAKGFAPGPGILPPGSSSRPTSFPSPCRLPSMFQQMLHRFEESFLTTETWQTVQKKIARSRRTWGE